MSARTVRVLLLTAVLILLAMPAPLWAQGGRPPQPGSDWLWTGDGWVPPNHPLAERLRPVLVVGAAVGTWLWTQGATLLDPTTGLPVHIPPEQVGLPSIMRLSSDGGVVDLCGVLHPNSAGASFSVPTPLGTVELKTPINSSEGVGAWRQTSDVVVVNWRKHLYDQTGKVMGYAVVIMEITSLANDTFEGYTQVSLFQSDGQPLYLEIVTGMPAVSGFGGPSKGVRMPLLRLSGQPI